MNNTYSVSAKLIQDILAAAEQMAFPAADLLETMGVSPSVVANADGRVFHHQWVALWQELAYQSRNPAIGVQLAERTQLEAFNVTGYAMSNSPTLGTALERLVRYNRLLNEGMAFGLTENAEVAILSYQSVNAALLLPATSVGWSLANVVLWARRSLDSQWPLLQVKFQQSAPNDLSTYRRVFQSTLAFDEPINALVFQSKWLNQPLLNADSGLCSLLDRYAESLLLALPPSENFVTRLHHLIAQSLRGHEPKLDEIATQMGYSSRSLQRKLKETNHSFQQVLDKIRRELACQYLQETSFTNIEIAFLLGFSENSAFNRAFRRWTGVTPGEYRKRVVSQVKLF